MVSKDGGVQSKEGGPRHQVVKRGGGRRGERGCRSKLSRRLESGFKLGSGRRRLTARLPCVTSPADTQPLGNRLGLDCCRRQGRPAGYHVGGSGPPPSAAAAASLPHGPARPGPCSSHSGRTGKGCWLQSRHHRASTPPQLGCQQLALTKGFRFSPVARLPGSSR